MGKGGLEEPPPCKPVKSPLQALQAALGTSLPQLAAKGGGSEGAGGQALDYYPRAFEFLSLGLLAYVGNDKALTQLEAFDSVQVRGGVGGGGCGSGGGGGGGGGGGDGGVVEWYGVLGPALGWRRGRAACRRLRLAHPALRPPARPPARPQVNLYGNLAFLLWKSVYITKQVGGWGAAAAGLMGRRAAGPLGRRAAAGLLGRWAAGLQGLLGCRAAGPGCVQACCGPARFASLAARGLCALPRLRPPAVVAPQRQLPAAPWPPQVSLRNRVLILFDWLKVRARHRRWARRSMGMPPRALPPGAGGAALACCCGSAPTGRQP